MSDMDKNMTARNTVRHDYRRLDTEGFGAEHQNYPSEAPMLTGAVGGEPSSRKTSTSDEVLATLEEEYHPSFLRRKNLTKSNISVS